MSKKELNSYKQMKQLLDFWPYRFLMNILVERIWELDWEIIENIWEWELKYTSLDLKRVERMILKQFLEMPEKILEEFDNIVEVKEKEA